MGLIHYPGALESIVSLNEHGAVVVYGSVMESVTIAVGASFFALGAIANRDSLAEYWCSPILWIRSEDVVLYY